MSHALRVSVAAVCAALVVFGGVLLMSRLAALESEVTYIPDVELRVYFEKPVSCESSHLVESVLGVQERNRACQTDHECTRVALGCPFGCWSAVNVAGKGELLAARDRYLAVMEERGCGVCAYMCLVPPRSNLVPVCDSGRCDVIDIGLPPGV